MSADGEPLFPSHAATVIHARQGWIRFDFRELWEYRELLGFLVWRDIQVRYRQTLFGALWAILQPVLPMIVFTLLLSRISGIAPAGVPYPLFVLASLVPWTYFARAVTGSSSSLVNASNLLQKVYFPRLLLPLGAVGAPLLDFTIALLVLVIAAIAGGSGLQLTMLWLLPLAVLSVAAALSLGVWLAAINVQYRDVGHIVPFLVQLLLFVTPVFYSSELVPATWRPLYDLNPMVGLVDGFRWAILNAGDPPIRSIASSVAVSAVVLVSGVAYFGRVERTFADVI